MSWYYHLNGNSLGPVTASDLQSLRLKNAIPPNTLVWTEGMPQWQEYQLSRAAVAGPEQRSVGVGVAGQPTQPCAECGQRFPEEEMLRYENRWVCAACKPLFFQRVKEGAIAPGTFVLANVGRRFVAVLIDLVLIWIIFAIMVGPFYYEMIIKRDINAVGKPDSIGLMIYIDLMQFALPIIYETFLIGAYGATLGKMAMNIKVIKSDGTRVSYARALGRRFAKALNCFTLYIGYLMAFWDEEKRALHDHICSTRVIVHERA